MPDFSLIILSAGSSSRFDAPVKKQWLRIGDKPLWLHVADMFQNYANFSKTILTASASEKRYMERFCDYTITEGGASRQASLKAALEAVESEYVLVTDVARACIPESMLRRILSAAGEAECIVPYLPVHDTVVYENRTIEREKVRLIQTPQLSKTAFLKRALESEIEYTDDSSAIRAIGGELHYVTGSSEAKKITLRDDIKALKCLKPPRNRYLIGFGLDVHAFEKGKRMVLGGVEIESAFGFRAHSDGDVALHALIDALLGAVGAGDIGEWYPDTDMANKDIDSKDMLEEVVNWIRGVGFEIVNIDLTIAAQIPKIGPHKERMCRQIAQLLHIAPNFVNVKATTTEKLGFVGREEGVAVKAVASLQYYKWNEK